MLDGNFIYAAIKVKLDIKERLEKLLQGETLRLFVLKSVLTELNAVGPKAADAFKWAKSFCTVIDDDAYAAAGTPAERLVVWLNDQIKSNNSSSSSSSKHYFVASQDKELRARLGDIPGVPTIYLNQVVLVLEQPSSRSKEVSMEMEASKVALTSLESEVLQKVSNSKSTKGLHIVGGKGSSADTIDSIGITSVAAGAVVQERKKRKATAANPLSNMKPSEVGSRVVTLPLKNHPCVSFSFHRLFLSHRFLFPLILMIQCLISNYNCLNHCIALLTCCGGDIAGFQSF